MSVSIFSLTSFVNSPNLLQRISSSSLYLIKIHVLRIILPPNQVCMSHISEIRLLHSINPGSFWHLDGYLLPPFQLGFQRGRSVPGRSSNEFNSAEIYKIIPWIWKRTCIKIWLKANLCKFLIYLSILRILMLFLNIISVEDPVSNAQIFQSLVKNIGAIVFLV